MFEHKSFLTVTLVNKVFVSWTLSTVSYAFFDADSEPVVRYCPSGTSFPQLLFPLLCVSLTSLNTLYLKAQHF